MALAALTAAAALPTLTSAAQGEAPATWNASVGLTRASSSSPLYRFAPDGALVLLDGRSRLSGTLLDVSLSGQHDWALANDWRPAVSARLDSSLSRQARDLEFGQLSLDASLRRMLTAGTVGFGVSLQRLWVSRQAFRDVPGVHLDWTQALGTGSHLMLGYDRARYHHAGDFVDLDARVQQGSAGVHVAEPLPGVSALDLQLGWRREDNRRRLADLSHLGRYLRLAADQDHGRWSFSAALTVSRSHYRAGLEDLLPARHEQSLSLELGASVDLAPGRTLALQAQWSRNRARPALYDNLYRSVGLSHATSW